MQSMYRMSQSCKIFVSNTKANTNKNSFPVGRRRWVEYLSLKRMLRETVIRINQLFCHDQIKKYMMIWACNTHDRAGREL